MDMLKINKGRKNVRTMSMDHEWGMILATNYQFEVHMIRVMDYRG